MPEKGREGTHEECPWGRGGRQGRGWLFYMLPAVLVGGQTRRNKKGGGKVWELEEKNTEG